ncbi:MAG: disulfide bond formation protein B [Alphaproteobacteria bacterium]|nr:disulfide bond formation protein B [Alphaproteobacteria bacterium]
MASSFFKIPAETRYFHGALALYAALSLGFALFSQYVLGLHPCELCIYQRIPLGLVIAVGVIALLARKLGFPALFLQLALFITEAAIAFYHTGVERKWWVSGGCSGGSLDGSVEDILARLQNTPTVRCDVIPWDLFGLSMANYNFILSAAIAAALTVVIIKRLKQGLQA